MRPHGLALKVMMEMGMPVNDIFDAAKEAGRQLVKDGKMSTETLKSVSRELLPLEMYVGIVNQKFRESLDALEKK